MRLVYSTLPDVSHKGSMSPVVSVVGIEDRDYRNTSVYQGGHVEQYSPKSKKTPKFKSLEALKPCNPYHTIGVSIFFSNILILYPNIPPIHNPLYTLNEPYYLMILDLKHIPGCARASLKANTRAANARSSCTCD